MDPMTGIFLNEIMMCFAFITWTALVLWAAIKFFKKDYPNFKRVMMYLINSLVFLVGVPFYVRLAIIVQGPKEATRQASMRVLRDDCIVEFIRYVSISILVCAIFIVINYLFQKYILNSIEKKTLVVLASLDFAILLLLSALAIFNYYIGISGEIESYHSYIQNIDKTTP